MQNVVNRESLWFPIGVDQHLAVSTAAVALTSATWSTAEAVLIQCQTNAVRVTFDTGTPSATNGLTLAVGDKLLLSPTSAAAASFIRQSADGVIYAQGVAWS
jgi:hypothetical protein